MTKIAIVGVEGSGKTVLMAALGAKYQLPDERGFSLKPNNFETHNYVGQQMEALRGGAWPEATLPDVMQRLGWTLQRSEPGHRVTALGEVPFLDYAGEVYRDAFGDRTAAEIAAHGNTELVKSLRNHVKTSKGLVVLVNLGYLIYGDQSPNLTPAERARRTREAEWLTQRILDYAFAEKIPNVALGMTQCDRYEAFIDECGGVEGTLRRYLPTVATAYPDLTVFKLSAAGKTRPDIQGKAQPVPGAQPTGLEDLMQFMYSAVRSRGSRVTKALVGLGLAAAVTGGVITGLQHTPAPTPPRAPVPTPRPESPRPAASAREGLYKVIDLTDGSISHLDAVPSGGWTDEYKTSKLVLRRIEPGTFKRGEDSHEIKLSKPFYIGVFEVTQAQWEKVQGSVPTTDFSGDLRPVESVSYNDIRGSCQGEGFPKSLAVDSESFLGRLRTKTRHSGFDLPTEAQWEYACRAGSETEYAGTGRLDDMGWYDDNSNGHTHNVGGKLPNAWGLYDMHGNVWEWCLDWYGSYGGAETDPKGSRSGTNRVLRGGSWFNVARFCRSAYRGRDSPGYRYYDLGFRLACSAGPSE